jgi:hypothetical protein
MDTYVSYGGPGGARGDRLLNYTAMGRELERISQRRKTMDDARAKDLDETRRLLYLAMVRPRTEKYELVGTLVHALKHHQQVDVPTEELIGRVIAAVDGEPSSVAWLQEQIDRVTAELS